jgi:hypothetical protein
MRLRLLILALILTVFGWTGNALAADATKAADISLIDHQLVTHNPGSATEGSVIGTAIAVTSDFSGCGAFFYAPIETADPTEGAIFRLQYSVSASGNEDWVTLVEFITFDTAAADETLGSSESAGDTALDVTDASTGFTVGDTIYVEDTGTVTDGEWNYVLDLDTTPPEFVHLTYGLTNAKDNSDVIRGAEIFNYCVDLSPITRIRVTFTNNNTSTGVNCHIKATMTKFTDIE